MPKMKYVGPGQIPGVPAKDLSETDVEKYGGEGVLVASGLYETKPEPKPKKKPAVRKVKKEG